MAYFAEILSGVVQRVVVADSKEWCEKNLGGTWVETFMDVPGKKYAGVGDTYHPEKDTFIAKKPFDSWVLDNATLKWKPPILRAKKDVPQKWNEARGGWDDVAAIDAEIAP